MSLDLYRRHEASCPIRADGVKNTKCKCPVWVYGTHRGQRIRQSMRTRNWSLAVRRLDQIEAESQGAAALATTTSLRGALDFWTADMRTRHLKEATIHMYSAVLSQLIAWATSHGLHSIDELPPERLTEWRTNRRTQAGELLTPASQAKEVQAVKSFFTFCVDQGWLPANPAAKLKPPRDRHIPTEPFADDEVRRLLAAIDELRDCTTEEASYARDRARACVLVLLYSGLRISDVAGLTRDRVRGEYLTLHAQKNGAPVKVLIPGAVTSALAVLAAHPNCHPQKYFWSIGARDNAARAGILREVIQRLGELAGVHAHPHRFRDTFACKLLESGAAMETVQRLLGHHSIKTTEKYYAHHFKPRQDVLDAATASLSW